MKIGDQILKAALLQAKGQVEVHKTNILVYQNMPAGIGEHSDVTEAVISELDKMASANDRIDMLRYYFDIEDESDY
tara:strand:- start:689 stop:916 length:228 start_codon:yes stop_codon:yes gene_type:complete